MDKPVERHRITLTDLLRTRFKPLLDTIGGLLNRTGLAPNTLTLLGLTGNIVGAYLISQGRLTAGGLVILAMGPVDAFAGTMARLRGEPQKFGAFVDSVTDRWSEMVILLGLLVYYL
ncbi:MAG: CDP-alcohol phosphatidyltransferase family protein, partial [Chloroflexi bacterium]|nr:CDP-alcohol phosphatidyltransferase family protein [Chloroflexota bacterium]